MLRQHCRAYIPTSQTDFLNKVESWFNIIAILATVLNAFFSIKSQSKKKIIKRVQFSTPGEYHWTCASFGPPESTTKTENRPVQSFLHSSRQKVPVLYNRRPFPQKCAPSHGGIWTRLLDNSPTGHLTDWSTRRLDNSWTGQVADWTTRGCHRRFYMLSFRFLTIYWCFLAYVLWHISR